MTGNLICVTTIEEAHDAIRDHGALDVAMAGGFSQMLKHIASGGTAVAMASAVASGFNLPEGATMTFSDTVPTGYKMRDQLESRMHRLGNENIKTIKIICDEARTLSMIDLKIDLKRMTPVDDPFSDTVDPAIEVQADPAEKDKDGLTI